MATTFPSKCTPHRAGTYRGISTSDVGPDEQDLTGSRNPEESMKRDGEGVAVECDGFGAGREDDTQPNFPTGILHAGAEQAGDDGPDAPFPGEVVCLSTKDGRKTKCNYDCIWSNHVQ